MDELTSRPASAIGSAGDDLMLALRNSLREERERRLRRLAERGAVAEVEPATTEASDG